MNWTALVSQNMEAPYLPELQSKKSKATNLLKNGLIAADI